jgi:single-stranded-DNA-specific exonuclease
MSSTVIVSPGKSEDALIKNFSTDIKAPYFVAEKLSGLGIEDKESARSFFVPSLDEVHDPFLLKDMGLAIDLAEEILDEQGKILVHGDYDVDGISGATLLTVGLSKLGFKNVKPFIPNRFKEGYGLCVETIERYYKLGYRYLITVDTGITAVDEVDYANELGMKVIIIDHHQQTESIPLAEAILNPQQKSCDYPNTFLCGAGVALKFIEALSERLEQKCPYLLDLFLLGTLADMMPVVGENRIYLKNALHNLMNSSRPGIKELLVEAKIKEGEIRAQDILFRVTPIINAVGRMGDPELALQLLLAKHHSDAQRIIVKMKDANQDRRDTEGKLTEKVIAQLESNSEWTNQKVILIAGKEFHQGVIGIVAAKLIDKYNKPVAVISIDEEGMGRASARSVEGFNWPLALAECAEWLPKWGGHYYAAGFNVLEENVENLRQRLNEIAERIEFVPEVIKEIKPDFDLPLNEVTADTLSWLQRFEPCGSQNQQPLFYTDQARLNGECRVVGQAHLKLKVQSNGTAIDAIGFGLGHWAEELKAHNGPFKIAYKPSWNYFKNRKTLQIQVTGIQLV